jgi:hypothetical protein
LLKENVNRQPEQPDYYVVRNHIVVLWCSSPCTNADEYRNILVAADFGDSVFNPFLDKVCRLRQVVVDGVPHGVEVMLGMALAAFRAAHGVAAKHEAKLFLTGIWQIWCMLLLPPLLISPWPYGICMIHTK